LPEAGDIADVFRAEPRGQGVEGGDALLAE